MNKISAGIFLALCLAVNSSMVQAGPIHICNLLISEVMANPSKVIDNRGEWFELFNSSSSSIDLNGLLLSDDGSNTHTITSASPLLVLPGQYFVLGNNADFASNGGLLIDYVYSGFALSNTTDEIIISDGSIDLVRLDYSGAPFGKSGISVELTRQGQSLNSSDYALTPKEALFQYGSGDYGTPGTSGSFVLSAEPVPIPVPATIWLFTTALIVLMISLLKVYRVKALNRIEFV